MPPLGIYSDGGYGIVRASAVARDDGGREIEAIGKMKLYNIDPENVYPDTRLWVIPGHADRAAIICTNKMGNHEWYPCETTGIRLDASVLSSPCMGFDPESYDPRSKEARQWVEEWSYPIEVAKSIVAQINR